MNLYPSSYFMAHFHGDDGSLLSGGSIEAFIASSSTPTPLYDEDGTNIGTSVALNARGEPEASGNAVILWLNTEVSYKFVLKDALGNVKHTTDSLNSGVTTDLIESAVASAGQQPFVSVNVADPDHDVDFSAGTIADSTFSQLLTLTAMTKRLDAAWATGDAAGGLFTGTVANSTTYHCFIIESTAGGVVDCGFDTSPTAANIPAGYTNYRKIGYVITDGSANITTRTREDAATVDQLLPEGTKMLFVQAAAPTGWTIDATLNDRALRINSGSGGSTGRTTNFDQVLNTTHTVTSVVDHDHGGVTGEAGTGFGGTGFTTPGAPHVHVISADGAHDHDLALDIKYVDTIVCTKDAY